MKKLLSLVAAMVLLLGACGSSEPEAAEPEVSNEGVAEPSNDATVADSDASDAIDNSEAGAGETADDASSVEPSAAVAEPSAAVAEPSAAVAELLASGSFCDVARRLEEDSPVDDLDIVDGVEEFYDDVLAIWDGLAQIAPDEIADDLGAIRDQFAGQREIAAQYDFDLMNLEAAEEIGNMDTTAAEAAQVRMESYLVNECGLELGAAGEDTFATTSESEDLDDVFTEEPTLDPALADALEAGDSTALLIALFGLEPDLASCLVEALDIDDAEGLGGLDPERLEEQHCGTSMIEVLSNAG